MTGDNKPEVAKIWQDFEQVLLEYGVSSERVRWYCRWAKMFASSQSSRLEDRTQTDVESFLSNLRSKADTKDWQVTQAADSLRILYQIFFDLEWAHTWSWPVSSAVQKRVSQRLTPDEQMPDAPKRDEVAAKFGDVLEKISNEVKVRHYSPRTERTYLDWAMRFISFHNCKPLESFSAGDVSEYLQYLALRREVSASTQNQALNALVFMFKHALKMEPGDFGDYARAKPHRRLPDVLSKDEACRLLDAMSGATRLMGMLLYGAGLRLVECISLRVKDIDFGAWQIVVRSGKGQKDRVTVLPKSIEEDLKKHLERVKFLHGKDLANGFGKTMVPREVEAMHPDAGSQLGWQYVFPANRLSVDEKSRLVFRDHVHQTTLQTAIREAAARAGLNKVVGCHVLRHSFATHLLENGYNIREIQELLGHSNVTTTMIYTHVAQSRVPSVRSPVDLQ